MISAAALLLQEVLHKTYGKTIGEYTLQLCPNNKKCMSCPVAITCPILFCKEYKQVSDEILAQFRHISENLSDTIDLCDRQF